MRRIAALGLVVALPRVGCTTGLESGVEPVEVPLATELDTAQRAVKNAEQSHNQNRLNLAERRYCIQSQCG